MTTYRVAKRARYTNVDLRTISDGRLSFRALGVLTFLLSKPDNWAFGAESLAAQQREGRDAMRAALRELTEAGYIVREREQGADGRWRTYSTLYEVSPDAGNPPSVAGSPDAGNPGVGKPAPLTKTETKEKTTSSADQGLRPRNPLWDALVEALEMKPEEVGSRSGFGACVKALKEVGATPEDVAVRADRYILRYGRDMLTANALVKHWPALNGVKARDDVYCDVGETYVDNVETYY